jgi:hypothetical protein
MRHCGGVPPEDLKWYYVQNPLADKENPVYTLTMLNVRKGTITSPHPDRNTRNSMRRIIPIILGCVAGLVLSTCDLFNNSMVDYFEQYSTMVTGVKYEYDFVNMPFKGRIYIPPVSAAREITVTLRNTRRYDLSVESVIDNGNTGFGATATVLDTDTILVDLGTGSILPGTSYDITLKLSTGDSPRPPFEVKLPLIIYGVDQDSINDDITVATLPGTHIDLPPGVVWVDTTIDVPLGKDVVFVPDSDGTMLVRRPPFLGNMIDVEGTLELGTGGGSENLIIDGNKDSGAANDSMILVDGGDLTMNDGVSLQNNNNGSIDGGAVKVSGGTFTMEGGTITGNESVWRGGGVALFSGSFTMNGGAITNNTAGGGGGGVYVTNSSNFYMTGGTISHNQTSADGGGLYMNNSSTFTMNGGSISHNRNDSPYGAGARVEGTCIFSNGEIINNIDASTKGDIYQMSSYSYAYPFVWGYIKP